MSHPGERFPNDSPATSKSQAAPGVFMTLSTVDGLSYTPSAEQKSRDLAQIRATGRRSWKTLKGKAEAVWSPEVEAVLIEALEKYQYNDEHKPTTSKSGIRFPYRNRFISDYIYEKTGKSRTHKQVGSRLQQLRDTCEDSRILSLISRGSVHDPEDDKDSFEHTVTPPPGRRAASASSRREAETERPKLVSFVQIVAQATQPPRRTPRLHFIANDINTPITLHLSPLSHPHSAQARSPSFLSFFSNVVQFSSAYPLHKETDFVIYEDERPVGQEKGYLRQVMTADEPSNTCVYECELAATYWKAISESKDPNRITILQSLVPSPVAAFPSSSLISALPMPSSIPRKLSVVYHFELGEGSQSDQFVSSGHSRPVTTVTSGYEHVSGPYERTRYSPGHSSEGMAQPLAMWAPSASGYQGRDVAYNVGFAHQPHLPHAHSYPPTVGYHSENYVLETQSMTRTHSGGSSGGYSDYDIGSSDPTAPAYYGEPRAQQQWLAQGNPPNSHEHSATRRSSSAYGVDYAY